MVPVYCTGFEALSDNPLHRNIHHWYGRYGRQDLPWRTTRDPYRIYLSEVMLQQTQVNTVLERFYQPFLQTFPSLQKVAEAPLDAVLKHWQGLGYYNRAKNLHRTAQLTKGRLPDTLEALQALPGIGKNTAHAVLAFAFHQPVPIMEANVKRVLCRMHKIRQPKDKMLWDYAYQLLDTHNSFDYNQAMMDIGAQVCTPTQPKCDACPLQSACKGKESPSSYPVVKKRKIPTREQTIVVRQYKNTVQLYKREGKLLHGLWGFAASERVPARAKYLGEVQHQYTHFKLQAKVYLHRSSSPLVTGSYYDKAGVDALAISKMDEKIMQLLCQKSPRFCQGNKVK